MEWISLNYSLERSFAPLNETGLPTESTKYRKWFCSCSKQDSYFSHFTHENEQNIARENAANVFNTHFLKLETTKLNLWDFLWLRSIYQFEHKSSDRTQFNWHSIKINNRYIVVNLRAIFRLDIFHIHCFFLIAHLSLPLVLKLFMKYDEKSQIIWACQGCQHKILIIYTI